MINFYILGIAFILMHEMDAIRCREWRIFPGLSYIKNDKAGLIFARPSFLLDYAGNSP
jgi:hypothetical protein